MNERRQCSLGATRPVLFLGHRESLERDCVRKSGERADGTEILPFVSPIQFEDHCLEQGPPRLRFSTLLPTQLPVPERGGLKLSIHRGQVANCHRHFDTKRGNR